MKTKFLNLLAALALAAAALATQSAAAYGAVAVGVGFDSGTSGAGDLVIEYIVDNASDNTNTHLETVRADCDAEDVPTSTSHSTSCRRVVSNVGLRRSFTLERQCFGIRISPALYTSSTQRVAGPTDFGLELRIVPIVFNPNDSDLDTDAEAIAAARMAATDNSTYSFGASGATHQVDLADFTDDSSDDNVFAICDTTPLSTCRAGSGVGVNMAGDACEVQFDPSTACTGNQAESVGGGSCEECGDGTRPILPSRTACEFDPTSCELDQFAEFGDCVSCSQVSRVAGTDGANCGACIPNFIPNEASAGGVNKPCMLDPTSCGENQYGVIGGNSCESCSDLNREGGVAGANCGACQEFHSTNSATLGGEADDAAGNHTQCNFAQGLCTGNNRVEGTTCVACPANHAQDGNDNTICVFAPDSCGENEYADTTDEMCESCGDINRQAGAAGADCGACVANHMHADATGGEGDACTFDPTSCTGMAQFSPGNTATECGTCATLNREGADGTSCGTCLTDFEHATENDGGITECTAIDDGGDGGSDDFGVVLPTLPDSEIISGQGTTETPYTVPSDSLTAFMFPVSMAIVNGSGNYSYRLDASSSEFLQIDEDGVVSFTAANVGTATYSIIIEITDTTTSETTTVTIVVAVAETTPDVRCEGGTVNSDNVCECPGETSLSNGACVCPSGTENNGQDECEPLPPACVGGTVDDDNMCICPGETSLSNGACVCPSGMNNDGADMCVIACTGGTVTGGRCICPLETTLNNGVCGAIVEGPIPSVRSESSKLALGIGAGLAAFMLFYVVADYPTKADDIVIYEPSYSFQHNNGNMQYSLGGRWTAAADNWRFYWQTRQDGGDNGGQFHYGSGMQYHNGIFLAALNSHSDEEQTAMDVSFSAAKSAGLWQLGGRYNFDLQSTDTQIDTQNRVDISADYTFGGWLLSAAARHDTDNRLNVAASYVVDKWILAANANTDGDGATAKINYSYRF